MLGFHKVYIIFRDNTMLAMRIVTTSQQRRQISETFRKASLIMLLKSKQGIYVFWGIYEGKRVGGGW